MSCFGALCLVRVEAPCDLALLLLLTLPEPSVVSVFCPVLSGNNDRPFLAAFSLAFGAAVEERLALDCPAVVLPFAFALGAGVDELLDPVRGVGNTGAGFKCEYNGDAPC